jgi:sigma-B regulation protein RsbU (phosphoserine phosphatase)
LAITDSTYQNLNMIDDIPFNPDWEISPASSSPARTPRPQEDDSIPVVIAEDDPVSRKLVTTVIEMGGFRTIVANDGDEAMLALRAQKKPCLAVVDWMMPGMDGAEICRRMRESGRNVYIIMLTARGTKQDTIEGIDHGADDYLVKPFDPEELLARIRAGIRQLNTQIALETRVQDLQVEIVQTQRPQLTVPL